MADIKEIIEQELFAGGGLQVTGAQTLVRAAGRKAAHQRADQAKLDNLASTISGLDVDIDKFQADLDALVAVEEPALVPYDDTPDGEGNVPAKTQERIDYEAELALYDAYAAELDRLQRGIEGFKGFQASKSAELDELKAFHGSQGVVVQTSENAMGVLLAELMLFVQNNVGPSACGQACDAIEAYLTQEPDATIVKIKSFENLRSLVVDADLAKLIVGFEVAAHKEF